MDSTREQLKHNERHFVENKTNFHSSDFIFVVPTCLPCVSPDGLPRIKKRSVQKLLALALFQPYNLSLVRRLVRYT